MNDLIDRLSCSYLMDQAVERTGLADFGPDRFIEPLGVLVNAIRNEAQLTAQGAKAQVDRLINSLECRLRKMALLSKHPEILDQQVRVGAVIVGLPRTGSTMMHRLLAASPQLTATVWWETIYPIPLSVAKVNDFNQRIEMAQRLVEQILGAAEGFDSMHPLDALAHDEELTLIEHSFVSNMPESMMYVPSYGDWLLKTDQTAAYYELVEYLQILQWQSDDRASCMWVLKSPHHLTATQTVLDVFPEALIVVPHRAVDSVLPSWYSTVASLSQADSDMPELARKQAVHWTGRLGRTLSDMMAVRLKREDRFFDVGYKDLMADPIKVCVKAMERMSMQAGAKDLDAFAAHLNANKREMRPSHDYRLDDYGIHPNELREVFAEYSARFEPYFW